MLGRKLPKNPDQVNFSQFVKKTKKRSQKNKVEQPEFRQVADFDLSKYPDWLFRKKDNKWISKVLESDDEERDIRAKAGNDLQLAEYRADLLIKELGLDKPRKKEEIYKGSSPFLVQMNLQNASRPLDHLISKVSHHLLTEEQTEQQKATKTYR